MGGAPDVVQPPVPRAARSSVACLRHVSRVGGARCRGCAAAAAPECWDVPYARGVPETFLLVDGENIDATLGAGVLGRRPAPEERPRWDRVRDYARAVWDQPVRGLFFLNGSSHLPMAFVQALAALEFRPVPLSGPPDVKVVDVAIQRTLEALAVRGHGDVLLASHDGDFATQVAALVRDGRRRVGLIGF